MDLSLPMHGAELALEVRITSRSIYSVSHSKLDGFRERRIRTRAVLSRSPLSIGNRGLSACLAKACISLNGERFSGIRGQFRLSSLWQMVNTRSGLANPGTSAQGGLSNSMDVDNQATNGGGDNAADVQRALAELKTQNEQLQKVVDNQTSRVKELEAQLAADALKRVDLGPSAAAVQKLFGKPPSFSSLEKSQNVREWLFSMKLLIEAAKFTRLADQGSLLRVPSRGEG